MSHSNQHLAQPSENTQSASLAETKIYKDWVAPTLKLLSLKINEVEKLRAENEVLKRQNRHLLEIALKGEQKDLERPERGAVPASSTSFIQPDQRGLEVQALREGNKELSQQILSLPREKNPYKHLREENRMLSDRPTKYENHLPSRVDKSTETSHENSKDDLIRAKDGIIMPDSAHGKSQQAIDQNPSSTHAGSGNDLNSASKQLEHEVTKSRKFRKQVQTTDTSGVDALGDLFVSGNLRRPTIQPVLPMRPNIQPQEFASPSQPKNTSTVDAPRSGRTRVPNPINTKKKSKVNKISRDYKQDLL